MAPGGILCLDLSSTTGWAVGRLCDAAPQFGCWVLPKTGGEGGRYASFENCLAEAMDAWCPSRLVLEAPLTFQAMLGVSTMKVMQQQLTLRGIAYAEAWRASVPIEEVSSDIVRLAVLGQSRFKKGTVKAEVVSYCRGRGWKVPDHNAADAALTWVWIVTQLRGGAPVAGRLFQERQTIQ